MANVKHELEKRMRRESLNQEQLAASIGVSPPFLSAVMRGKKPPTPKILKFLRLQKRIVYWRINGREP